MSPDGADSGPLPQRDEYYMALAFTAARRANCRGRKVGAVLVKEDRVIATGYNGTNLHLATPASKLDVDDRHD